KSPEKPRVSPLSYPARFESVPAREPYDLLALLGGPEAQVAPEHRNAIKLVARCDDLGQPCERESDPAVELPSPGDTAATSIEGRHVFVPEVQRNYRISRENLGSIGEPHAPFGPGVLQPKNAVGALGEFEHPLASSQSGIESEHRPLDPPAAGVAGLGKLRRHLSNPGRERMSRTPRRAPLFRGPEPSGTRE